jgi:hypothetical protein
MELNNFIKKYQNVTTHKKIKKLIENNNKETFFKIIDILSVNEKNIKVEFLFLHSGLTIIRKIKNTLNESQKVISKEYSFKNILKKLINKLV